MLGTLGLDAISEAVYRSLLAHPQDDVPELVARLGQSEQDVRQALATLVELALLRPSHDREGTFRAVSPQVGMELLMARQQAELAAQQSRVEASRVAAAQLIAEYADLWVSESRPGVEHLTGLDEIRDRLSLLTSEVRCEVMTFAPGGSHTEADIAAAKPLDEDLLERGVRMRTIYLDSIRNSPATVDFVSWLASQGGQVRTVPTLPIRMIIVDRAKAVIPAGADSTAGAVVLTGHGTLTALCALFENVWASARPLGEATVRDPLGLSAQEATAIRLLGQGFTDEAIGKRLGISTRTARRLASDLMQRLGARSRFEAGVRAVQQGWLPSSE
jgi:DNA-binding CsgD family transcriptional regulator